MSIPLMSIPPNIAPSRPAELLATLGAKKLAEIIVSMSLPAGTNEQWDSETIEQVLQPLRQPFTDLGIQWIGNTSADDAALRYWQIEARKRQDPSWELIDETVEITPDNPITRDILAIDLILKVITRIEPDENRISELRQEFLESDVSNPDAAEATRDQWEQLAESEYDLTTGLDENDPGTYRVTNLSFVED